MSTDTPPVWGHELQYWLNLGTSATPDWVQVTELLSWANSSDTKSYEPKYLDRQSSPKFAQGRTESIEWTKDYYKAGEIDAWLLTHRNDLNIACQIAKVYSWDGTATALTADMADFLFNPQALTNEQAEQAVIGGGALSMASDGWDEGTWNPTTKAFTATVG